MRYDIDLTQVTLALSDALDLVGVHVIQHGKRVAAIALETGRRLGLSPEDRHRLLLAGVLHDCGVSSTETHRELIFHFDWEQSREHAERGYELLRGFPPFAELAELVRHHHTHWDELSRGPLPRPLALQANLLFLADRVDALVQQRLDRDLLIARKDIQRNLEWMHGEFFSPDLLEAFDEAAKSESLWLMLEPHHLERYLTKAAREAPRRALAFAELRTLAEIFSRIVDAKSPFTAAHSRGVARLARFLGELRGLEGDRCDLLELSGLLHDLGKLRVPDAILHKPGPLTEAEFAQMERHTFETYQILSRIEGLEDLPEWAAFHHETLTGEGYPFHRGGAEMPEEARIVAVADVFQALAQERPYRHSLEPAQILTILREMAEAGRLDASLVDLAADNAQACWDAAMDRGGVPS